MNIAGREIGPDNPPYIIAEVSCNHGGELEFALELIDAAKACGADAVKFQAYQPELITLDCDRPEFIIEDGPWKGRKLIDLYRETYTPFLWFPAIAAHAKRIGITWFASCFDRTAVDLMVKLDAPAIKIASFEIVDTPLIRYAASTGKPLFISTGMASEQEILDACDAIGPHTFNSHALLHCISGYPAPVSEASLFKLKYRGDGFVDGISDHSTGPEVPIAATALGACIIEKHFRLSEHPRTEDAPFSLDQYSFTTMTEMVRNTWTAMQPSDRRSEQGQRPLRRSLFCVADVKAGETFTEENVRSIRPGHGLPPAATYLVIGWTAARDISRGEPMAWEMVR